VLIAISFAGTRVPIRSLFDHLEAGDSIDDFLQGFPSVQGEQIRSILEDFKAFALANELLQGYSDFKVSNEFPVFLDQLPG
jgi:hypothetical protein